MTVVIESDDSEHRTVMSTTAMTASSIRLLFGIITFNDNSFMF